MGWPARGKGRRIAPDASPRGGSRNRTGEAVRPPLWRERDLASRGGLVPLGPDDPRADQDQQVPALLERALPGHDEVEDRDLVEPRHRAVEPPLLEELEAAEEQRAAVGHGDRRADALDRELGELDRDRGAV